MSATAKPGAYRDAATGPEDGAGPVFAGTILSVAGILQFFQGLSAVLKDDVYVATPDYLYRFDLTAWGWTHLVVGALAFVVGTAVLMAKEWAMVVGIVLAALSLLLQFLFVPWQPVWAITLIGIDLAVIWGLAARLSRR